MTTTSTGISEKPDYTPKQRRLIERYRDINTDYEWWDCTSDEAVWEDIVANELDQEEDDDQ
jgi:hypothetical protein